MTILIVIVVALFILLEIAFQWCIVYYLIYLLYLDCFTYYCWLIRPDELFYGWFGRFLELLFRQPKTVRSICWGLIKFCIFCSVIELVFSTLYFMFLLILSPPLPVFLLLKVDSFWTYLQLYQYPTLSSDRSQPIFSFS